MKVLSGLAILAGVTWYLSPHRNTARMLQDISRTYSQSIQVMLGGMSEPSFEDMIRDLSLADKVMLRREWERANER